MNCLIVSDTHQECEGCATIIRPGIVGMTNEITGRLVAQCPECLMSLDHRLALAWASLPGYGALGELGDEES